MHRIGIRKRQQLLHSNRLPSSIFSSLSSIQHEVSRDVTLSRKYSSVSLCNGSLSSLNKSSNISYNRSLTTDSKQQVSPLNTYFKEERCLIQSHSSSPFRLLSRNFSKDTKKSPFKEIKESFWPTLKRELPREG